MLLLTICTDYVKSFLLLILKYSEVLSGSEIYQGGGVSSSPSEVCQLSKLYENMYLLSVLQQTKVPSVCH